MLCCPYARAITVAWTDWLGNPQKQYLQVPADQQDYLMTISEWQIIKNCGGGQTTLTLTPDANESGHLFVTLSGVDGVPQDSRNWSFNGAWTLSLSPGQMPAPVKASTNWCPGDIRLTVINVGPYLYYRNTSNQCVAAQTEAQAVCMQGCQTCRMLKDGTTDGSMQKPLDMRRLLLSPFATPSPQ